MTAAAAPAFDPWSQWPTAPAAGAPPRAGAIRFLSTFVQKLPVAPAPVPVPTGNRYAVLEDFPCSRLSRGREEGMRPFRLRWSTLTQAQPQNSSGLARISAAIAALLAAEMVDYFRRACLQWDMEGPTATHVHPHTHEHAQIEIETGPERPVTRRDHCVIETRPERPVARRDHCVKCHCLMSKIFQH